MQCATFSRAGTSECGNAAQYGKKRHYVLRPDGTEAQQSFAVSVVGFVH